MKLPIIGFVGLSHLGLNSAVATAEKLFEVYAYDNNEDLINELNQGRTRIIEPKLPELLVKNKDRLQFTNSIKDLNKCDIIYISLDVPTDNTGNSDLVSILDFIDVVKENISRDKILVILCQVPPAFTRKIDWPKDKLFYQVETLIFGRAIERALYPERFIVGCDKAEVGLADNLKIYLESFQCPILPMKYESAELAKISINMFLISSVSTTNMIAEICENINASWQEIVPALRLDKRIGKYAYLLPGLGIAGGNLERDISTLSKLSEKFNTDTNQLKAWVTNSAYRKDWVFRILNLLNLKEDSVIGILGLTYKENTHSIKNSASIELIKKLNLNKIKAFDPARPDLPDLNIEIKDNLESLVSDTDILIIMTPWGEFKEVSFDLIKAKMKGKIIIDPYGVLKHLKLDQFGYQYYVLGEGLRN